MNVLSAARRIAAATVAGLMLAGAAAAPAAATASVLQQGLDDLRGLGITGAQGLVLDGNRVTFARSGVADPGTGAPMPADGYVRIGSETKTFVAVLVLQLVGEGRIGLDDPVERRLPGVVDGRQVTVRQLLQQTSGLYDPVNDLDPRRSADYFQAHRFDHYTDAELVATAVRHPPLFPAGTDWNYSNTNYVLAGMLVERVTGHRWDAEVGARILAPLGLTHTFYPGGRTTLPRPHAQVFQQFPDGGPLVDATDFDPTLASSAGGLVSTTGDLARFWQALIGGRLLRPAQQAVMLRTLQPADLQSLRPGAGYGLGVMWLPNRCGGFWTHVGGMPGVDTLNAVSPDGRRSAVFYVATSPVDADGTVMRRELTLLDDLICG